MANEKRLIYADDALAAEFAIEEDGAIGYVVDSEVIRRLPTVDAVELPKGKPGDYLVWDNGLGYERTYYISAVLICKDCMRYELEDFSPAVNHPKIMRIMTPEEAKRWLFGAKMDKNENP